MLKGPQKVEHLQGLGILEVSPHGTITPAQIHVNGIGASPMESPVMKVPKGPKSKGPRRPRSVVWYYFEKVFCSVFMLLVNVESPLFCFLRGVATWDFQIL